MLENGLRSLYHVYIGGEGVVITIELRYLITQVYADITIRRDMS